MWYGILASQLNSAMILKQFKEGPAEQSWGGSILIIMMLLISAILTHSLVGGKTTVVGLPKGFPKTTALVLSSHLRERSVMGVQCGTVKST